MSRYWPQLWLLAAGLNLAEAIHLLCSGQSDWPLFACLGFTALGCAIAERQQQRHRRALELSERMPRR